MKHWNEMTEAEMRRVCMLCPYYFAELDECMIEELYPIEVCKDVNDKACAIYKEVK